MTPRKVIRIDDLSNVFDIRPGVRSNVVKFGAFVVLVFVGFMSVLYVTAMATSFASAASEITDG